jgi:hypothetical protein
MIVDKEKITKHLLGIYENKKGNKGQFNKIMDFYEDEIMKLHLNGKSVSLITSILESDLNYSFPKEPNTPFHRAVYVRIKKLSKLKDNIKEVSANIPEKIADKEESSSIKAYKQTAEGINLGRGDSTVKEEVRRLFE